MKFENLYEMLLYMKECKICLGKRKIQMCGTFHSHKLSPDLKTIHSNKQHKKSFIYHTDINSFDNISEEDFKKYFIPGDKPLFYTYCHCQKSHADSYNMIINYNDCNFDNCKLRNDSASASYNDIKYSITNYFFENQIKNYSDLTEGKNKLSITPQIEIPLGEKVIINTIKAYFLLK